MHVVRLAFLVVALCKRQTNRAGTRERGSRKQTAQSPLSDVVRVRTRLLPGVLRACARTGARFSGVVFVVEFVLPSSSKTW